MQIQAHKDSESICLPVMTVTFPFEQETRHVSIVAAALASLSDSDLTNHHYNCIYHLYHTVL